MKYLPSIDQTQYHHHHSKTLDHDYHIYVHTPKDSKPDSTEIFPTVYLLDGGITYPLLAAYSQYLSLAEEIPKLMIVGISYGSTDFREGNKRGTDFTAPATTRDHYGGAARFQAMLRDELFPMIERNYPSDPNKRILFGQSLGGQFSVYNAVTQSGLFYGLIASNPALHRNVDYFLQLYGEPVKPNNKPLLFISRAEHDDNRFKEPAQQWIDHWQKQKSKPFVMEVQNLDGHNHFSAAPDAFRNGLIWILGNQD